MFIDYLSRKFKTLSIIAMLMVIMIHSIAILDVEHPALWLSVFQWGLCRSFTDMAVPFFFLMSGYWFVKKAPQNLLDLYRSKFYSLVVPYFLWAVIGAVLIMPVVCASNVIGNKPLFARTILAGDNVWSMIDALLGITIYGPVGAEPLWFVRALIFLFLAAPMWLVLIKFRWGRFLLIVISISHIVYMYPYMKVISVFPSAVGWFVMGIVVGMYGLEKCRVPNIILIIACFLLLIGCVYKTLVCCRFLYPSPAVFRFVLSLIPIGGIVALWGLYDRLQWLHRIRIPRLLDETFWVYCSHQILGGYIIPIALKVFGRGGVGATLTTLVAILIQTVGAYWLAYIIHKRFPYAYLLLTGGRSGTYMHKETKEVGNER